MKVWKCINLCCFRGKMSETSTVGNLVRLNLSSGSKNRKKNSIICHIFLITFPVKRKEKEKLSLAKTRLSTWCHFTISSEVGHKEFFLISGWTEGEFLLHLYVTFLLNRPAGLQSEIQNTFFLWWMWTSLTNITASVAGVSLQLPPARQFGCRAASWIHSPPWCDSRSSDFSLGASSPAPPTVAA